MLWYMVGIVISGALFALGLILTWYWLVAIGIILLPAVAVWGMVSSGPGSPYNPYHH